MNEWTHEAEGCGFVLQLPESLGNDDFGRSTLTAWTMTIRMTGSGDLSGTELKVWLQMLQSASARPHFREMVPCCGDWLKMEIIAAPTGPVALVFHLAPDVYNHAEIRVPMERGMIDRLVPGWVTMLAGMGEGSR